MSVLLIHHAPCFQFVRRIIRHSLEYLAEGDWDTEEVAAYSQMLSECIINANENSASTKVPVGLQIHVTNLFLEELAKVVFIFFTLCVFCDEFKVLFILLRLEVPMD